MRSLLLISLTLLFISACASNPPHSNSGPYKNRGAAKKNANPSFKNETANSSFFNNAGNDRSNGQRVKTASNKTQGRRTDFSLQTSDTGILLPTILNAKDQSLMVLVNSGVNRVSLLDLPRGTLQPGKQGSGAIHPSAFYLDRLEITVEQYKIFDNRYDEKLFTDGKECPKCPAMGIDWTGAHQYCLWAGKRLPTEAEWVAAASGESGNLWPWGNTFSSERANLWGNDDGSLQAAPVGSYPQGASPYGLLDMTGNVWEWVSTAFLPSRQGPEAPPLRIIKGGGWTSDKQSARISFRNVVYPSMKNPTVGFRCAQSI
ncbi:MAG: hypothetical protein NPINA01_02160 [Nitrospinaceae bacterium]|nr:MAG: hypothetical protein NPINA01_02160 [Nitrospinaceae bacterium]